jgi:hypothetical protein
MTVLMDMFVLCCAAIVLLRVLCVLDHMSSQTRWVVQWMYALESGGVIAVAVHALDGNAPHWSTLLLLAGVTLAHVFDGRRFPPRRTRRTHTGRRGSDTEWFGSRL